MCGIAGFWAKDGRHRGLVATARLLSDQLAHRGPDDSGVWVDQDIGIALAHRRLSIIDLSSAGHQPMVSNSGRYVVVYNGEIYNHRCLRAELEARKAAPPWRGTSDTEVLVAAIDHWGIPDTLSRINGMFAFAAWDRREACLYLARDRLGEKPLYYGSSGGVFLFGSELKALRAYPAFRGEVDRDALALYLRHNCVPAPHSIWLGIKKLPPAYYVRVDRGHATETRRYWDFRAVAEDGARNARVDEPALVDELEALLTDAVEMRMEADVPLGAFLSGGIDSSTVVALMQAHAAVPVRTFTIGFEEGGYDEAGCARAVAAHLGTNHTELYVSADDAMAAIPDLPRIWDEPFSDSSQIPTYLVSRMTRRHVTVSLSGDGGDELFGGYNRHFIAPRLWRASGILPQRLRNHAANLLDQPKVGTILEALNGRLPRRFRLPGFRDRLSGLVDVFRSSTEEELYLNLVSHWREPATVVLDAEEPRTILSEENGLTSFSEKMMYLDTQTYLPDDILTKVDRASMAVGLEARVPFLDHRVVELAWSLPESAKIRDGVGKRIVRQILYRHVPRALIERPKTGFAVPIDDWLRGPLREWAEELLDERRLRDEGFFAPGPIREKWREHKTGRRRWHYHLWDVLMFQAWWAEQQSQHAQGTFADGLPEVLGA